VGVVRDGECLQSAFLLIVATALLVELCSANLRLHSIRRQFCSGLSCVQRREWERNLLHSEIDSHQLIKSRASCSGRWGGRCGGGEREKESADLAHVKYILQKRVGSACGTRVSLSPHACHRHVYSIACTFTHERTFRLVLTRRQPPSPTLLTSFQSACAPVIAGRCNAGAYTQPRTFLAASVQRWALHFTSRRSTHN